LLSKFCYVSTRNIKSLGRSIIFVICILQDLNELAAIVRGELPNLSRAILCALITIDVHGRDMITGMVKSEVG